MDNFKGKRVLITGSGGFIGRYLCEALIDKGAFVFGIDKRKITAKNNVVEHTVDLRNKVLLRKHVTKIKPQMIFHLAAYLPRSAYFDDFYKAIDVNLIGSMNLFHAIKDMEGIESVVILGTAEEYGDNPVPFGEGMKEKPGNAYAYSKFCLISLCRTIQSLYDIPFVMLRPTLAYGPGQEPYMFLPSLIKTLISNKPFKMTAGEQTRDFIYITDLVEALIKISLCKPAIGKTINVGTGKSVKLRDLALKVGKLMDKTELIRIGDIPYRKKEIMEYRADISLLRRLIHWTPEVTLYTGLRNTVDFFQT